MKIKKYELQSFISFLHSLKLDRTDSRMRTRFKKLLIEKYQPFMEEMNEINENYAIKDNEGNLIITNERYSFENNEERLKEIFDLSNEVVVIDQNEENKAMLLSVKESVLHRSPTEFSGDEADVYDCLAEIVEQIEYN